GLNAHREGAYLLDLAQVAAHEVALLQLVGEQEVAILFELGRAQVALEETRRGGGFILGASKATVGAHLCQLGVGIGLGEVLFEDVAAHQVVVIGKALPQVEVAGEKVGDVHALLGQRFRTRRPERRAKLRIAARIANRTARSHYRQLCAARTDAEVLRIRSLDLSLAQRVVVAQHLLFLPRERQRPKRPSWPGRAQRDNDGAYDCNQLLQAVLLAPDPRLSVQRDRKSRAGP